MRRSLAVHRLRRLTPAAAVALLAAAWLQTAPVATAQAPAAKKPNRLVVRLTDVSLNKLPYIIAKEEKLYEKYGVDVDPFITTGAARTVKASGVSVPAQYVRDDAEVDISTSGGSPVIVSITQDVREIERVILATTDHLVRWHVFAKPGITKLDQIKGKRLGVSSYGSCTGFIARLIAQHMKWNPEQDLSIMFGSLGVKWLQDGVVDAVVLDETPYAYALSVGLKPIADLSDWKEPIACSGVSVTKTWLAAPGNRDRAKKFLQAMAEGIAMMKKDPAVARRAIEKWYGITDPKRQELMLSGIPNMEKKPYPAVAGIKKVMQLFDYHEMRQHKAEDFYDASLMKELDDSGFIDGLYKN